MINMTSAHFLLRRLSDLMMPNENELMQRKIGIYRRRVRQGKISGLISANFMHLKVQRMFGEDYSQLKRQL